MQCHVKLGLSIYMLSSGTHIQPFCSLRCTVSEISGISLVISYLSKLYPVCHFGRGCIDFVELWPFGQNFHSFSASGRWRQNRLPDFPYNTNNNKGTAYVDMSIFENFIYMKLYSLLISTKNTKKVLYCHVNTTVCIIQHFHHECKTLIGVRKWW